MWRFKEPSLHASSRWPHDASEERAPLESRCEEESEALVRKLIELARASVIDARSCSREGGGTAAAVERAATGEAAGVAGQEKEIERVIVRWTRGTVTPCARTEASTTNQTIGRIVALCHSIVTRHA